MDDRATNDALRRIAVQTANFRQSPPHIIHKKNALARAAASNASALSVAESERELSLILPTAMTATGAGGEAAFGGATSPVVPALGVGATAAVINVADGGGPAGASAEGGRASRSAARSNSAMSADIRGSADD